jgi:hypothetical protein
LPRLTQRQREARWQRERRQQTIIVVVFTVLLCSAVGLMLWAGTNRYYDANLKPAAMIDGHELPYRLYYHERDYELVKFYQDSGVPVGLENDPQLASQKRDYDGVAVNSLVEQVLLETMARQEHYTISDADLRAKYEESFGQFNSRHILVKVDDAATDKAAADAASLAKAQDLAKQLRADPNSQDLWNTLAKQSDDTGSKSSGGEIGWVGKGQLVTPYEDAATKLKIGEISDPVKTTFGYHVIQVKERRTADANPVMVERRLRHGRDPPPHEDRHAPRALHRGRAGAVGHVADRAGPPAAHRRRPAGPDEPGADGLHQRAQEDRRAEGRAGQGHGLRRRRQEVHRRHRRGREGR